MHSMRMVFSQVTALARAHAVSVIPSISPRTHRLTAFLHKSSTCSCTEKVRQQDPCRARGGGGSGHAMTLLVLLITAAAIVGAGAAGVGESMAVAPPTAARRGPHGTDLSLAVETVTVARVSRVWALRAA